MKSIKSITSGLYRDYIKEQLCELLLFTMFTDPKLIINVVNKYLSYPLDIITLNKLDEKSNVISFLFTITFKNNTQNFNFVFERREDERVRTIIPKVVKKKRKWWQINTDETEVIIETQEVDETTPITYHLTLVRIE